MFPRVALLALLLALAAAALLLSGASAVAGNGGATSPAGLQVEQLGPKYLLGPKSPQTRSIPAATRAMLVEEFGPKYLLGYELKAAEKQRGDWR
jgi:hypothetical protein